MSTEVLGLGAVAVDEILCVDQYPPADAKAQVRQRERRCGGLAATALVAAARLGCRCAYAGVLGRDDASAFAAACMEAEGIDLSQAQRRDEARVIRSAIVADLGRGTRNIFFDLNGVVGAGDDWPPEAVIRSAQVLLVDFIGMEGMIRAARIAQSAGVPVVADLEDASAPGFAELLGLVDHLVLSHEFALGYTGEGEPARAAQKLWRDGRALVAITCGAAGYWVCTGGTPVHCPAFAVETVDTTGCGDVFHGAYAAGLARGLALGDSLRLASAAAALKASRRGGQEGIPTRAEVEHFFSERSSV
ncbi:MAG: permease [Candidatus Handelsmanbacteria bacterium]|nr:permease [Candidatus Handelsmanbacteria bacterium]